MYRKFLRAKLHGVTVTDTNLNYAGSITIDRALMEAAGLEPFEMVKVVNLRTGDRFETYVIEGEKDSGYIGLNGGAARKGREDDQLIIFSSAWVKKGRKIKVKVVIVDPSNRVREIRKSAAKS